MLFVKRNILNILNDYENNPEGWLYLPEDSTSWTDKTEGVFVNDEYGEHEREVQNFIESGWVETIDKFMIEDVIYNVKEQIDKPTFDELFKALLYFIENDAYKVF